MQKIPHSGARRPKADDAKGRKIKAHSSRKRASPRSKSYTPHPIVLRPKVLRAPNVGKLQDAEDFLKETVKVYRQARRGEVDERTATKLIYMLNCGAQQVRSIEEAHELKAIRRQLEAIGALEHGAPLPALPPPEDEADPEEPKP